MRCGRSRGCAEIVVGDGKAACGERRPCGSTRTGGVDKRRVARVWSRIEVYARAEAAPVEIRHACIACAEDLRAIGVGLSFSRGGRLREPVFATDPRSEELEELQFTLGEGPCVKALTEGTPVLVDDVSAMHHVRRWPVFVPAAARLGVRSMFAVPIRAGAAKLGVLEVYREQPGSLTADEVADLMAYADVTLALAVDLRGGVSAGLDQALDAIFTQRSAVVHQAAGMVSVELGVGLEDALAALRAHAFHQDRRLGEVAADVVARRLRLSPRRPSPDRPEQKGGGAE